MARAGFGGRALALAVVVSAACAPAACGGTEVGPGEDAGAAEDAQPPGEDAAPAEDAGSDAADAAPEAAPDAGPRWCATLSPTPRFCDDFDDGSFADDWTVFTLAPAGSGDMDLDPLEYVSAPASLNVVTDAVPAQGTVNIHLRRTLGAPVSRVKLAFALKLPTVTLTKGAVAIATLDVSSNHFFSLFLRDESASPGPSLEETTANGTVRHALTKLPPANAWTRVTIDLDLAAGKADVLYGSEKVLDQAAIVAGNGTEATARIGAVYVLGPADPFAASFDDVVLDY